MTTEGRVRAKDEIHHSIRLTNFCTRKIGLSFIDDVPKSIIKRFWLRLWFTFSALCIGLLVVGELLDVISKLMSSTSVETFVSKLHVVGYGIMSCGKLLTLWSKKDTFRNLLNDLADLWPLAADEDAVKIKQQKLARLRVVQFCYALWNLMGVTFYTTTPLVLYLYHRVRGEPASLGYIWQVWYPFDKTKPILHEFAFIFEAFAGLVAVWAMLGSDIIFMTMSSHISMLLDILQLKIRRLGSNMTNKESETQQIDNYNDIKNNIKIHQRLISKTFKKSLVFKVEVECKFSYMKHMESAPQDLHLRKYGNDLEDAFSVINLINVLLSSINICCVVFNILLEPLMEMSNKLFLGAALTQVGILCWYADEITTSSTGIGDAAYQCEWINTNIRFRRTLLLLIQRSQKPLHFTAYKFRPITMSTYSSIIANSYSYFTLLYTVYRSD